MCAARGAADAAGADRRKCGRGRAPFADRYAASPGRDRAGAQPRAVAERAAASCGDRMGDGADRDRASRRRSPIRGCIRRSTRLLAAIEAAPSASGWGAALVRYELLLLAELGLRPRPRPLRRHRRERRSRRGQPALRPGCQRGRGRALCRRALTAAAVRSRRRAADLAAKSRDGLDLTGHFLMRDVLTDRSAAFIEARSRLVERLRRAGGARSSRCLRAAAALAS